MVNKFTIYKEGIKGKESVLLKVMMIVVTMNLNMLSPFINNIIVSNLNSIFVVTIHLSGIVTKLSY